MHSSSRVELPEWSDSLIKISRLIQAALMFSVIIYGALLHFAQLVPDSAEPVPDPELSLIHI